MVNEIVPPVSTSLPEVANEAFSVVLEAVISVCTVYDVDFRDFVETHEDVMGELLDRKVDFVLTDPP